MKKRQFYRFKIWWHRRLWHIAKAYPYRLLRLFGWLGVRHERVYAYHKPPSFRQWLTDYSFLIADLLFVFDIYELIAGFSKESIRSMTPQEREIARTVFSRYLDYELVLLDEKARIATRKYNVAYVSANTINSWGGLSNAHLIHELVHVWQYQRFGAVYIPRALRAQYDEGYDYGGIEQLKTKQDFFNYNPEQQGDIIADYYRLLNHKRPCWGNANLSDRPHYKAIIERAFNS
jgi:hypothetical protein